MLIFQHFLESFLCFRRVFRSHCCNVGLGISFLILLNIAISFFPLSPVIYLSWHFFLLLTFEFFPVLFFFSNPFFSFSSLSPFFFLSCIFSCLFCISFRFRLLCLSSPSLLTPASYTFPPSSYSPHDPPPKSSLILNHQNSENPTTFLSLQIPEVSEVQRCFVRKSFIFRPFFQPYLRLLTSGKSGIRDALFADRLSLISRLSCQWEVISFKD